MRKVKISDYEQEKHELLIAVNMVGIHIDYITLDLIWEVMQLHNKKGNKANIQDCCKIKARHEDKWQKYFEEQDKKEGNTEWI